MRFDETLRSPLLHVLSDWVNFLRSFLSRFFYSWCLCLKLLLEDLPLLFTDPKWVFVGSAALTVKLRTFCELLWRF